MRVRKVEYNNIEGLMIYITKQEELDEGIKKKIADYRKAYKEVVVFISGSNSIESLLANMIQERR
ncbi:MAG: hypothetical protein K0Q65_1167 [Clostridia bacterium]|jgi:hypothetical protein|nr:hypothetical protein [Clostridia bacterium]